MKNFSLWALKVTKACLDEKCYVRFEMLRSVANSFALLRGLWISRRSRVRYGRLIRSLSCTGEKLKPWCCLFSAGFVGGLGFVISLLPTEYLFSSGIVNLAELMPFGIDIRLLINCLLSQLRQLRVFCIDIGSTIRTDLPRGR